MPGDQRISLPRDARAPARARAWVAERTAALPDELAEEALLVVSELVTNAIRHGRPDVVLGLEQLDPGLRILVSDCGEALPVAPLSLPDPDAPSGRGLLIVASTAADWGVRPNDGEPGKTVWADLREAASVELNGRRQ